MGDFSRVSMFNEVYPVENLELGEHHNTMRLRKPFDPVEHDLDPAFRLTRFADLKGGGSKFPTDVFSKLLKDLDESCCQDDPHKELSLEFSIGACITPLQHADLCLIQSTDTLYPIVDDPYIMGRIVCAHVLSGLYALGVIECDNMLMLLSIPARMTEKERDAVIPLIMTGIRDCALEAGSSVTGGQTVINPWCSIGTTASAVCRPPEYIDPCNAIVGDVLVLTKPLGTQIAGYAHQWLLQPERWKRIKLVVSEEDVRKGYHRAMDSMARLNKTAARLLHKYNASCAAEVGGYGLLGHAQNLAKQQKNEVSFVIHNLPVIAKMGAVAKCCGNLFQLMQGNTAETSGGLLICLPREQAAAYCKDIEKQEGYQAWIIGIVERGDRTASIISKPRVIEVPSTDKEGQLW